VSPTVSKVVGKKLSAIPEEDEDRTQSDSMGHLQEQADKVVSIVSSPKGSPKQVQQAADDLVKSASALVEMVVAPAGVSSPDEARQVQQVAEQVVQSVIKNAISNISPVVKEKVQSAVNASARQFQSMKQKMMMKRKAMQEVPKVSPKSIWNLGEEED
jgi:hypothetical protein